MYLYQATLQIGAVELNAEARQHVRARRLKVGDQVCLFDGKGSIIQTKISDMDRKRVVCMGERIENRPQQYFSTLVVGVTKLPTLTFILQKACEIGVAKIILLRCQYTPVAFDEEIFQSKYERWMKIMIAACEQSRQVYVPQLSWLSMEAYRDTQPQCVILDPRASQVVPYDKLKTFDIVIGPEGGFSEEEISWGSCYRLNTGILRTDTAAMAALLLAR